MTRLLFLCSDQAVRAPLACALAMRRAPADLEVFTAGAPAREIDPAARRVLREAGIAHPAIRHLPLDDLRPLEFDVVVGLCPRASRKCGVLPGRPGQVEWDIPDPLAPPPADDAARLDAVRRTRDLLGRLIDDFFERGYLDALALARRQTHLILDNLSEGILAHDFDQRIFYFNRAAESITGYARDEVLGKKCPEVFPQGFCGGKCAFRDGQPGYFQPCRETMDIHTANGETRRVDMAVRALEDSQGKQIGLLASFRDATREHDMARRLGEIEQFAGIVGRDSRMIEIFELIRDLADAAVPVLIQGESGTGKELVAAAIHNEGPRARGLFVPVNCAALPESLLESELFGHVRGAFTGAVRDKKGRFELADGGTIFLDEIGDISPSMQVKLLRVLQEGAFQRLGSEETIHVDVRVISATNKDLAAEIAAGRFREDLFYRIGVMPIHLPPLRHRPLDIPLLARHALQRALRENGRNPGDVALSEEAMQVFLSYGWPGNVRELQNWVQFALVKCKSDTILPEHLPPASMRMPGRAEPPPAPRKPGRKPKLDAHDVRRAMKEADGNKAQAARILGVARATLYRFLERRPDLV